MSNPRLSACLVLYHSQPEVLQTVQCLMDADEEITLYVVDNSPEDGMAERIKWLCPGAVILPQSKNLGFGRANNVVLPLLKSQYHLLVNPDVTFERDLLTRMIDYMDRDRDAAILTPRVFNENGTEQFLPKRQPTIRYLLGGRLEGFGKPFTDWRREYTLADAGIAVPTSVGFATGCFLLIRTQVFQRLQGFDPRFFLYQEDSDLSMKVIRSGRTIVYHPEMTITHAWARENTRTLKGNLRQVASIIKYALKWGIRW